jgi:ribosomal protein S18 acetylase RimI-like enzyme
MHDGPYHFNESYEERFVLADGTPALLRLVRPDDRELFRRGFEALSPRSRYLRFFATKNVLSEHELTMLTSPDGERHFAIGAARVEPDGSLTPAGVARFVRLERKNVAEAAIAVVDAFQSRGLGKHLLTRLSAAARERGIERFHCEFAADNERIRHLVQLLEPGAPLKINDDVVEAELLVPEVAPNAPASDLDRGAAVAKVLTASAKGAIEVRLRRLLLKLRP